MFFFLSLAGLVYRWIVSGAALPEPGKIRVSFQGRPRGEDETRLRLGGGEGLEEEGFKGGELAKGGGTFEQGRGGGLKEGGGESDGSQPKLLCRYSIHLGRREKWQREAANKGEKVPGLIPRKSLTLSVMDPIHLSLGLFEI